MQEIKIGSEAHRDLFCQNFFQTHRQYEPETLPWPELDSLTINRVRGIPFWSEAIRIENKAGIMVSAFADTIADPVIKEAIALQGQEEARHSRLIKFMTKIYGVEAVEPAAPELPAHIESAFVKFGYGECIDSFFAFGLFEIGKRTEFFPESLLSIFDNMLQEEARHISFFVNWIAYLRVNQGRGAIPVQAGLTLWQYGRALLNLVDMIRGAAGGNVGGEGFTATGAGLLDADLTIEKFLAICLSENDRRLSAFDHRLLRPQVLPALATMGKNTLKFWPSRKPEPQNSLI